MLLILLLGDVHYSSFAFGSVNMFSALVFHVSKFSANFFIALL